MFYKLHLLKALHGINFKYYGCTASTNAMAKEYSKTAKSDCLFIAKSQTHGRGRKTRTFFSKKGGVYFSLCIKDENSTQLPNITALTAVAVINAINKLSPNMNPKIKWVNDIYIDNKKVCGILCEKQTPSDYTVIGVGINTATAKDIPTEIKDIYGAINNKVSYKYNAKLINEIVKEIYSLKDKDFYDIYKENSFVLGKEITVIKETESFKATAVDIEKDFSLLVQKENELINLSSGEISIKL